MRSFLFLLYDSVVVISTQNCGLFFLPILRLFILLRGFFASFVLQYVFGSFCPECGIPKLEDPKMLFVVFLLSLTCYASDLCSSTQAPPSNP